MANKFRGVAISGLEFGGAVPGTESIDYFKSSEGLYQYVEEKGLNLVRIAFKWDRMQPELNGDLNSTYLGELVDQIDKAESHGLNVILDCHNYGRRSVTSIGGFTDDFSSDNGNFTGQFGMVISGGILSSPQWSRVSGGDIRNPISPANSYKISCEYKITSNGGGDTWRAGWIEVYRVDDNNKYFFTINNISSQWELFKVVGGVTTLLDSGAFTFNLDTFYTIEIDVGQTTPGSIIVKIDTVTVTTQSEDAALTGGLVGFYGNGVNWAIDDFVLDVDGDTSSGGTAERIIGDGVLTTAHFADFWLRMSQYFKNRDTIIGYDIMNEPHDMPVPATTSTFNTTATATLMYQAAIDAIRSTGDETYCIIELDNWANIHRFNTLYGSDPEPWHTDPLDKVVYSAHTYWDADESHSGAYSTAYDSGVMDRLEGEVVPFISWCKDHGVKCFIGEFGVPSNDEQWLDVLDTFYEFLDTYRVWGATYWAAGDAYVGPATSIQPTGGYANDAPQMAIVDDYPGGSFPGSGWTKESKLPYH